jgi:hypothetical protein
MNIPRILAQISPVTMGYTAHPAAAVSSPVHSTLRPIYADLHEHSLAADLMARANAMAARSPAEAQQLRIGARAVMSVLR